MDENLAQNQTETTPVADTTAVDTTQLEQPPVQVELPEPQPFSLDQLFGEIDESRVQELQSSDSALMSRLAEAMGEQSRQGQKVAAFEEAAGLSGLRSELTDIENELRQKSLGFKRDLEALQDATGLTAAQKNARLEDVSRRQNRELADLEVIRQSRSGRFEDARAAVDRKVELMVPDQKAKVENLKFFIERNDDLLSTAQKAVLDQQLKRQDFEMRRVERNATNLENAKLDLMNNIMANGGGNELVKRVQSAESISDAISIAGRFGSSLQTQLQRAQLNKINMEVASMEARERAIKQGEVRLDKDQVNIVMKLQDDFDKQSGEFIKQTDAYNRILASAEEPSAAGDLALIFNYMKVLDPGSTVREGEFANAQNAAGLPGKIRSLYNKTVSGQRLNEEQRSDFVDRAELLYKAGYTQQKLLESQFEKRAAQLNVPGDYVIRDVASVSFDGVAGMEEGAKGAAEIKDTVTDAYTSNPQIRPIIESLYSANFTDAQVLEYLQINNQID